MTLKEIAKEAGVSVSTVSRVINNNSKAAGKEVQDRIWEIVRRTGYTPNSVAQSLKLGAAQRVPFPGLSLCPDAGHDDGSVFQLFGPEH